MTWQRGRDDIDRLLAAGELEQVTPFPDVQRSPGHLPVQ